MKKKASLVFLAAVAIVAVSGSSSYAVSSTREEEDSAAGVRYYEPSSCSLIDSLSKGNSSSETTPGLSAHQAQWVDTWHETAQQLSVEYGIPWEAVMAQGIVESGAGTSYYATSRNNFFGLGAIDSNPDNAYSYSSPEEGWRGYYEFIRRNSSLYSAHGVFAEPTVTDPYAYLSAIKAAGYASAADYVEVVSDYIEAIEIRADKLGWARSSDLAKQHPEMLTNAENNRVGSSSDKQDVFLGDDCSCGNSSGKSTGVRWSDGFIAAGSIEGYAREEVIGTDAENRITSYGYGLSFTTTNQKTGMPGPDKITLRSVSASSNTSALDLYTNGNYPHFSINLQDRRVFQHFSANRAAAALGGQNREGGIVIAIMGDTSNVSDAGWDYLATLMKAIHEQYGVPLDDSSEWAAYWDKLENRLASAADESSAKCSSMDDAENSLSEDEAKKIANYYNSDAVKVAEWNLPAGLKTNCSSFVAYFVQRFTNIGKVNRVWGDGRDTAYFLARDYSQLSTGTDPKPLAVFSTTNGVTVCGNAKCGHTGIVVAINNGIVTTIEAGYPNTEAHVATHPISYFVNTEHPYQFTYLSDQINESELTLGKQGR